jgi:hypothetical protein
LPKSKSESKKTKGDKHNDDEAKAENEAENSGENDEGDTDYDDDDDDDDDEIHDVEELKNTDLSSDFNPLEFVLELIALKTKGKPIFPEWIQGLFGIPFADKEEEADQFQLFLFHP